MTLVKHVNSSFDTLVDFIFLRNKTDSPIQLELPINAGSASNQELFTFFSDLMLKGLVVMYGGDTPHVNIDSITREQIDYVAKKLKNVGIQLTLEANPTPLRPDFGPVICKGPGNELKDYVLLAVSKNVEYIIKFSLTRVLLGPNTAPVVPGIIRF